MHVSIKKLQLIHTRRSSVWFHCKTCKVDRPIDAFYKDSKLKLGYCTSRCKHCRYEHRCTEFGFFSELVSRAKGHQANRHRKKGVEPPLFRLTVEHLQELYKKQNMLGFYSHIPLKLRPLSDWQVSLERLNPSCDYIPDNVVLEALEFNNRCQWNVEKILQIP
eukprot:20329_1